MSAPARDPLLLTNVGGRLAVEVNRISSDDDLFAVLDIRRRVFAIEQGVPDLRVSDPDDARSLTALARFQRNSDGSNASRAVSTGRLTPWPAAGAPVSIAWVATLPAYRGLGFGEQVMRFLLDSADSSGIQQISLAAQAPAERFYRRLGFVPAGSRYDVRGISHVKMVRRHPG